MMHSVRRWLRNGVLRLVARPRLTLALAGAGLAAGIILALLFLSINTDQDKLFSSDVPFFRDWLEFARKFPENEALYVLIEPADDSHAPPVKEWAALADRLEQKLRSLPRHIGQVSARVRLADLGPQGILFNDPEQLCRDFEDARRFVPLVKLWAEEPGFLNRQLGSTPLERFITGLQFQKPDEQTARFVEALARGWARTLKQPREPLQIGEQVPDLAAMDADDPSRLGYNYVADESDPSRHVLLVRVNVKDDVSSLTAGADTIDLVRGAVREAAKDFPQFRVGVTGRPALDADEMRTTDRDTHRAEIVAMIVVFLALLIMLRSLWLAVVAVATLAIAIGWTFGYATLSIGELNLLSIVFLIALIGIGMDYLIQILMAYRRELPLHADPRQLWAAVFESVGPPVTTACMGAAGAFAVAAFTDFRGAAQLGIIAGGGLLLCLLAGCTVLPAILTLWPAAPREVSPISAAAPSNAAPKGWLKGMILPVTWGVALLLGIPFAMRSHFNPNLLELQSPELESVKLIHKLQSWSAVVMSKDLSMLRNVQDAVRGATCVQDMQSILMAHDNHAWLASHPLPPIAWARPAAVQPDDLLRLDTKASALERLYSAYPSTAVALHDFVELARQARGTQATAALTTDRLSQWQELFLEHLKQMLAQFSPPPLNVAKLPRELREHWVSNEGDYALYINLNIDGWKRSDLEKAVAQIESRVAKVPGHPSVTGIAVNICHSTQAVERAFYQATAYALVLIALLVLIDLRRLGQTLAALSVLALGLPVLVAIMGLLGVSWNFANFFGLPILLGAAHEYGVFTVHRYREALRSPRRAWRMWDDSDRALLLCAIVTSASFGFFWALGHHPGLRSLGLVMALGTACIYLAAVLVVRPLLRWRLQIIAQRLEAAPEPEEVHA